MAGSPWFRPSSSNGSAHRGGGGGTEMTADDDDLAYRAPDKGGGFTPDTGENWRFKAERARSAGLPFAWGKRRARLTN